MLKRIQPTRWWSRTLWIAATYIIAADFLPNLLLVLINSAGYLPYSDRPGPGWQTPHFPAGQELGFFAGFAVLLLPATAITGMAFAATGCIFGYCRLPRWVLRVIAAPVAFMASGMMMAGVGWLIAISAAGVYVAAGCGLLWAIFVFPVLVPGFPHTPPLTARIALPVIIFLGAVYWLLRPLVPDPALTNARIEVIQKASGGAELSSADLSYVGPEIARETRLEGRYVSLYQMEFTTDERNQVRVLLIIDDDHPVAHTFALARSGNVIYQQSQGQWKQIEAGSKISKLSLELKSDSPGAVSLEVKGPCCSSMSERPGPSR